MDMTLYAFIKKYVDNSIEGTSGALAGKNCTIQSTAAITGGTRVTFAWTNDNGVAQTSYIDVMNGTNGTNGTNGRDGADGHDGRDGVDGQNGDKGDTGISVTNVEINDEGHLICTLSDETEVDAGLVLYPPCPTAEDGKFILTAEVSDGTVTYSWSKL